MLCLPAPARRREWSCPLPAVRPSGAASAPHSRTSASAVRFTPPLGAGHDAEGADHSGHESHGDCLRRIMEPMVMGISGFATPVQIEVRTVIRAAPTSVFDLELDVQTHMASLPGTGETATTSTGRSRLCLGDEVTFRARHLGI